MNTSLMLDAAARGDLEEAERFGLQIPQVPMKVVHLFGPGFCIRELHIPAGTFLIGHAHKEPLANMLIQGSMLVRSGESWSRLIAPFFFVGTAGRKAAYAITDSIWQNILVTNETDPDKLEALFTEPSEAYKASKHPQLQGELT